MKRRQLLLLLGGTLTSARVPRAQQKTMPMIGFLNGGSADTFAPYFAAFRNGLAAMGYVDGQNVAIEYRNAEGHYDRLPAFAADLVQRNVSAIAVVSLPAVLAAKAATTTIPILFVTGADPVAAGLVASFNRPGGNLTGISQLSPTMVTKQIELLREIVPKAELMGVVVNPTNRIHESQLAHLQAGALVQKIRLSVVRANTEQEIKAALAAATTSHFVEQSLLFHTPDALRLPDRPSIAVLPFTNMSGDPEQEYFADGMVEEIITALSRIRWLFVIARNSTFTYKGQAVDVKQIGRELGVRYVLEGSVRKGGNRVRITAQLIDALTDTHLWADRFDGSLEDIFALQDRVAISVAGVIEPALQAAETARSANRPTNDLTAYDLYLRAYPALWSSSRQIP